MCVRIHHPSVRHVRHKGIGAYRTQCECGRKIKGDRARNGQVVCPVCKRLPESVDDVPPIEGVPFKEFTFFQRGTVNMVGKTFSRWLKRNNLRYTFGF